MYKIEQGDFVIAHLHVTDVVFVGYSLFVVPIAARFGVSNKKRKPLAPNPVLESSYKTKKHPDQKQIEVSIYSKVELHATL